MTEQEIQDVGHVVSPSPMERAKYAGVSALGIGFTTGVFGMGSFSLAFAAIAAVGGGVFAEEIRDVVAKRRRGDKTPHRFTDMRFWLQGSYPEKDAIEMKEENHPAHEDVHVQEVETPPQEDSVHLSPVFPIHPDNETLKLGQAIDKEAQAHLSNAYIQSLQSGKRVNVKVSGQRFDPHFNALFGKGIIAAANQGFGKSILNGVIIEQAGKSGVPVMVLDHKGEYQTVKALPFVNVLTVGACDTDFILTAGDGSADELVELVMTHRYQAIVNLPSYGSSWVERAKIVASVGKALMDYAEAQRQLGAVLLPCLVIVDEAQLYFPQDRSYLPAEARKNPDVLDNLSNAYFSLVSNGRSNGYTMCFSTQSLTYVAKALIKSCQVRLLGRHGEKNDLDMCCEIINSSIATRKDIETLPPGVFVVFGFTVHAMVVQFDKKQSHDLSETPGIERLRGTQARPSHVPVVSLNGSRQFPSETHMETPPQAARGHVIENVFPASREMETPPNSSVDEEKGMVSEDKMETIRRMKTAGFSDRDIASLVGLAGRKYKVYQYALQQLGYAKEG